MAELVQRHQQLQVAQLHVGSKRAVDIRHAHSKPERKEESPYLHWIVMSLPPTIRLITPFQQSETRCGCIVTSPTARGHGVLMSRAYRPRSTAGRGEQRASARGCDANGDGMNPHLVSDCWNGVMSRIVGGRLITIQ